MRLGFLRIDDISTRSAGAILLRKKDSLLQVLFLVRMTGLEPALIRTGF